MKEDHELTAWELVRLEDVTIKVGSGSTPRGGEANYKKSGVPLIRSMNVVFFGFKRDGLAHLDDDQATALDNVTVRAGDVLLNITGASIGRVTMAPTDMDGARVNQHVCIIRPSPAIDGRFLNAFLSSPAMQQLIFGENYGVTRQALTKLQILDFNVPLPPLFEQKRIADKLEAVLRRVDACRDRLDRVPDLLKRFRQSVLAAATCGQLTDDLNDAEGWNTSRFGDLFLSARTGLDRRSSGQSDERAYPYLKMNNITSDGRMTLLGVTRVDASGDEIEKYSLNDGDFLFNTRNSAELVGKTCVFKSGSLEKPFLFNNNILRVRFKPIALADFINMWFCSPDGRAKLEELKSATTSVAAIYQSRLNELEFKLPPPLIQQEIVRRVEALFAFADRIEARLTAVRAQVERLTPATLAKAFRGELVPQDPNDEPASELLERLASSPAQPKLKKAKAKR